MDVEISTIGVIKIIVNELMKLLSEYDPNMKVVVVDGRKIIEIDCLGSVINMHTNESQCTINTTTLWDK